MKQPDPFYKTAKWKHKRALILSRDGYQDQIAKRYGKMLQADTVHHIFPREDFPEYEWCSWNMISLNHVTHNMLHDRMTDQLTDAGKDLMRRTARARGMEV